MLFGYPVAATQFNWLHDCICDAVKTIHALVDMVDVYPDWPGVLPERYRAGLARRTGLRDRLKAYDRAIRHLTPSERSSVLDALESENLIADLVSGARECAKMNELPAGIRESVKKLFESAFDLLTDTGSRDEHYAIIVDQIPARVCPFCGIYPLSSAGGPREDLDHYLARSIYPFASANLRNLVPMCHSCNTGYKQAADILRDAMGVRRHAFDPYDAVGVDISLDQSSPFSSDGDSSPRWEVGFVPETPEVRTWDEVFRVRERIRRDVLEPDYNRWLRDFRKWVLCLGRSVETQSEVRSVLADYQDYVSSFGLSDRAFLRAAAFKMLLCHLDSGNQRLLAFLRVLLQPTMTS